MRLPAQLLSPVPGVRVAATAGRGHHAAHLGSRRTIAVLCDAPVQVRLLYALIDVLNGAGHSVASSTLPWTRTAERTATKAWVLRSGCVGEDTSQGARLAEHPEAV